MNPTSNSTFSPARLDADDAQASTEILEGVIDRIGQVSSDIAAVAVVLIHNDGTNEVLCSDPTFAAEQVRIADA